MLCVHEEDVGVVVIRGVELFWNEEWNGQMKKVKTKKGTGKKDKRQERNGRMAKRQKEGWS